MKYLVRIRGSMGLGEYPTEQPSSEVAAAVAEKAVAHRFNREVEADSTQAAASSAIEAEPEMAIEEVWVRPVDNPTQKWVVYDSSGEYLREHDSSHEPDESA